MRVTQSEFARLAAEKIKLQTQIKEIIDAQNAAVKAHKKALEDLRVAQSKEEQLRKQIDLVNRRAEDAIAVKSRKIKEIKQAEGSRVLSFSPVSNKGFNLHLSPNT
jgi:chromosome segregation ATPase